MILLFLGGPIMPNEAMKKLQPFFEKKERLNHLLAIINFDVETCAPEQAIEEEDDLLSFYEAEYVAIDKDPEYIALVKEAKQLALEEGITHVYLGNV